MFSIRKDVNENDTISREEDYQGFREQLETYRRLSDDEGEWAESPDPELTDPDLASKEDVAMVAEEVICDCCYFRINRCLREVVIYPTQAAMLLRCIVLRGGFAPAYAQFWRHCCSVDHVSQSAQLAIRFPL